MLSRVVMSFKIMALPWLAALLLQGILAGIVLTKRMWRKLPFFLAYAASNFLLGLGLYLIYHSALRRFAYMKVYWVNEAAGLLLGLAVVYEIFRHLFTPYPALRRLASQIFLATVSFLLLLGCVVAYAQPLREPSHLWAAFMVVEQASRILEVGLLCFLFLFASVFGLHWRQNLFGIALGLGVFAAVELVAITMRVQFGIVANPLFNVVRTISFNASLIIWISYLLAPDLATNPSEMPKRAVLEQWNTAVMELIYQ